MAALSGDDWYYMCLDSTCKNLGTEKCCGLYGCHNYESYNSINEKKETDEKKNEYE